MSDRQKTRARPTRRHAFAPSYGAILEEGVRRRSVLKGYLAAMGAAALSPALGTAHAEAAGSSLTFPELKRVRDTADHWPEGYERQILARWGDALFSDSPEFDIATLDGKAAERHIAPVGSEACSPTFTPDGSSVFLSIQHPGELRMADNEDATSMEDAGTDWPDFKPGMPARPSLVVLSRVNNDVVGS
ncbi:DUF839 domain-containing protein [Rhizobium leguminosarum]|uniref:DUF839 domain-containing protein n=1 Tax=Rhizobium leguminosarum TaxID=384 RepID=UPI001DD1CD9F|nr:DUF839 domain-containing protein [Rhizobium leguminosarum]MBY5569319.1 DUF839 domain-containing protein [Rhizobium leguminosarum]MBY5576530.1 DUF839 domain-containing protein [Rhizobium leguminosarum]